MEKNLAKLLDFNVFLAQLSALETEQLSGNGDPDWLIYSLFQNQVTDSDYSDDKEDIDWLAVTWGEYNKYQTKIDNLLDDVDTLLLAVTWGEYNKYQTKIDNLSDWVLTVEELESVIVIKTNQIPVEIDNIETTDEETSITIDAYTNHTDPDRLDVLRITEIDSTETIGLASLNEGIITYYPNDKFEYLALGEIAKDRLTYTVSDLAGATDITTLVININGVNNRPIVSNLSFNAVEDGIPVTGNFLVSDLDSSDTHVFNILNQPSEGSVVNNNDGTFTFDPGNYFQDLAQGETRQVTFNYTATDNSGVISNPATITFTVEGSNAFKSYQQAFLYGGSQYDPKKSTIVITHGFRSSVFSQDGKLSNFEKLAQAFQSSQSNGMWNNSNLILWDWSAESRELNSSNVSSYITVANRVMQIGREVAEFLVDLGVNPDKTQLIGHSLGSHVMGNAAATYRSITDKSINTIAALDPAGPLFESDIFLGFPVAGNNLDELTNRLDENDANRVVALHTSSILGYDSGMTRDNYREKANLDLADFDLYVEWFDLGINKPGGPLPTDRHSYAIELLTDLVSGKSFKQDYKFDFFPDFFDRSWESESSTKAVGDYLESNDIYNSSIIGYDLVTV